MPGIGQHKKIPDALLPEVMKMAANGATYAQIQQWLLEFHQISISLGAISNRITTEKRYRRELAEAVIIDEIAKTAIDDVQIINETIHLARAAAHKSLKAEKAHDARQWFTLMGNFLDKRARALGFDTPEPQPVEDQEAMLESLMAKLTPNKTKETA